MRRVLCLTFLGCALVVGLACSGDSSTPTAPAAATTVTAQVASVVLAPADKLYICHGDRSSPYGVVTEVSDETYKRHYKHLGSGRDCECPGVSIAGAQCHVGGFGDPVQSQSCECPSGV